MITQRKVQVSKKKKRVVRRKKREAESSAAAAANKRANAPSPQPTELRRSNSANALLGLSVLLYPDRKEYNLSMNNYYGFKVVLAAAVWYGYLAYCEIKDKPAQIWVLPTIFAVLAAWLGAEAFGLISLPDLVEYPDISRWGFFVSLGLVPISALREWMRRRRNAA